MAYVIIEYELANGACHRACEWFDVKEENLSMTLDFGMMIYSVGGIGTWLNYCLGLIELLH